MKLFPSVRLCIYEAEHGMPEKHVKAAQRAALGWVVPQALSKAAYLKWKNPGTVRDVHEAQESWVLAM